MQALLIYLVLILLPVLIAFYGAKEARTDSLDEEQMPSLESMQLAPRPRNTRRKKSLTRHNVAAMRR